MNNQNSNKAGKSRSEFADEREFNTNTDEKNERTERTEKNTRKR